MFDFSGQTIVVTGADRGIGRGIAESFLRCKARVIGTYHTNQAAVGQFLEHNHDFASHIDFQQLDISDYSQVERFYKYLENTYSSFQVLVNNSGIRRDAVVGMMPEQDWKSVIEVNLSGAFYMSKLAVRLFVSQRYGRIINITSPIGKIGFAGQANYAASKAGLVAMTKSVSREVATKGIMVNCVSPGFIETEFIQDLPEAKKKKYQDDIPLKRFGTTTEVAWAVLFLADPKTSYITGTTLEVTGGL